VLYIDFELNCYEFKSLNPK